MPFPNSLTNAQDNVTDVLAAHLNAVEAKIGIDGSAVTTSHDYKLSGVTGSDKAVSKTGTETLTNKTLTAPVISTIVNSGTLTLPTSSDTLVGRATTDTLTNKTLTAPVISTISNTGTLTLPTSTDTLVGKATTDVLTNKTLTSPIIKTYDGWEDATDETWTYASATSFTIASADKTAQYSKGTRLKLTQSSTVKYFVVTSSSYSTNTTVNITGGSSYTFTNAAVTSNYFSYMANPQGYPSSFSYTPVFTGFAADPTVAVSRFSVVGDTCTLSIALTADGTSNSTSFTVTVPIANNSGNIANLCVATAIDNGTAQTAAPAARISSASTTCTIYKNNDATTGWTNSGGKRFVNMSGSYFI